MDETAFELSEQICGVDQSKPSRLSYHAENGLSIIDTKRLWMRNATCMSDYREVHHGFDILAKYFSDKPRLDVFTTALDRCAPGAAIAVVTREIGPLLGTSDVTSRWSNALP